MHYLVWHGKMFKHMKRPYSQKGGKKKMFCVFKGNSHAQLTILFPFFDGFCLRQSRFLADVICLRINIGFAFVCPVDFSKGFSHGSYFPRSEATKLIFF